MKKNLILLFCLMPIMSFAQKAQGIKFYSFSNWNQLLEEAKRKHKNIFIDAYASWCGPCRKMDVEVYSDTTIESFVDSNFIAAKIQIDQTKDDPDSIRKNYEDANYVLNKYHIDAFPTFIFINPNGQLIHRDMGYMDKSKFMALIKLANDSTRNYFSSIQQFKSGKIDGYGLITFALEAKKNHEDSLSMRIAEEYKKSVIDKSVPSQLLKPELLDFLFNFHDLISMKDPIMVYMYRNPRTADSLLNYKGYSIGMTDYLILRDVVNPIIKPNRKYVDTLPNWQKIEEKLRSLYDLNTAKKLIIYAKVNYYNTKKDWPNIVKYNIENLDLQGIETAGIGGAALNTLAFAVIFQHSNDHYQLKKGIGYMERLLKNNPSDEAYIDTYANLLYKDGEKEKAIKQEQIALEIAKRKKNKEYEEHFKNVLQRMKNNQPTWD